MQSVVTEQAPITLLYGLPEDVYYKIKKRRGFRRNSSLKAAWDTSIARTTGFM